MIALHNMVVHLELDVTAPSAYIVRLVRPGAHTATETRDEIYVAFRVDEDSDLVRAIEALDKAISGKVSRALIPSDGSDD